MSVRLKPYPAYTDSGVPWLGQVPEHWETRRAKRLFQRMNYAVRPEDDVVTCFRDGVVTLRRNRRVRGFTESLKEIGYQGVRRGALVIHGMDAFAGAIGVSDSDGKCSPVYSVCQPSTDANARYYMYAVREMARSGWLLALARGIRERSSDFRFDTFGEEGFPVPPPSEQSSIVRFLDHFDRRINRLIRIKRRMIELLNEQKQAIIQQAVTRGLDPNARLKPSGVEWLGEIPEHWQVWKIGHFAKVGNGSTPSRGNSAYWSDGSFPWLNSAVVNQGVVTKADQFVTDMALRECHLPIVPPGSVLVAITGQGKTRGTAALLAVEATINQHLAYISPSSERVLPGYLQMYLTASYSTLRAISDDSGSTKGALTCQDVKHLKVAIPPVDEQEGLFLVIKERTGQAEEAIARAKREIDLLREYRTRLIADVVTGKLDVRAAAAGLLDEPELERDEAMPEDESEETGGREDNSDADE